MAENNAVKDFLNISRKKIEEGRGLEALQAVINAIILSDGEGAILNFLDTAKQKANEELFQEQTDEDIDIAKVACGKLLTDGCLLNELGDENILVEAFKDGSSVICKNCNSLVAKARMKQHSQFWCEAISIEDEI